MLPAPDASPFMLEPAPGQEGAGSPRGPEAAPGGAASASPFLPKPEKQPFRPLVRLRRQLAQLPQRGRPAGSEHAPNGPPPQALDPHQSNPLRDATSP